MASGINLRDKADRSLDLEGGSASKKSGIIDLTEDDSFIEGDSASEVISDTSKSIISDSDDETEIVSVFSPKFNATVAGNKTLGIKLGKVPATYQPKLNIPSKPITTQPTLPALNKIQSTIPKNVAPFKRSPEQLGAATLPMIPLGKPNVTNGPQQFAPYKMSSPTETLWSTNKTTPPSGRSTSALQTSPFENAGSENQISPVEKTGVNKKSPPLAPSGIVNKISPPYGMGNKTSPPLVSSNIIKKTSPPLMPSGIVNQISPHSQPSTSYGDGSKSYGEDVKSDQHLAMIRERATLTQNILIIKEKINQIVKTLSTANLDSLADKGDKLRDQLQDLRKKQGELHKRLRIVNDTMPDAPPAPPQDQPYKRPGTLAVAESLSKDALIRLHSSIRSCPLDAGAIDEGPQGLKVELLPHQKRAMAWVLWREKQHPKGGILADDMGLGKTLTMIALILRSKELKQNNQENLDSSSSDSEDDSKYKKGGTLVVCPASVMRQWESEIKNRCERKKLSCMVYHGKERPDDISRLLRKDVVITTYNLVGREGEAPVQHMALDGLQPASALGMLFSVQWERVILDEAHQVRNPKTKMSKGVCALMSKYRWCLTGTPIHNKMLDLYSLIKFLHFTPFNNEQVWKRCTENKSVMGQERINAIMKSILLRRTKQELQDEGQLKCLPKKEVKIIPIELSPEEDKVYQFLQEKSKTLMAKFMMQRAEKLVETGENIFAVQETTEKLLKLGVVFENNRARLNSNEEKVKASSLLFYLLRLRQICCHPSLVKAKLEPEAAQNDVIEDEEDDVSNLVDTMNQLDIDDSDEDEKEVERKKILSPDNPIYDRTNVSSKIRAIIEMVLEVHRTDEKVVLVSQWTSMLDVVDYHLRKRGVNAVLFTGKLDAQKRQAMLDSFNKENYGPKVMLLSLTAGGTGVNLIGGNHLVLMDIHWNPQLEAQAMDRVFRVGQKRDVKVYRFICSNTVEQSIQEVQEKKLAIADRILSAKNQSKLNFEDLQTLFLGH